MSVAAEQGQTNLAWGLLCGFVCHVWHGRYLEQHFTHIFSALPSCGRVPVHGFTLCMGYQVLWPLQRSQSLGLTVSGGVWHESDTRCTQGSWQQMSTGMFSQALCVGASH